MTEPNKADTTDSRQESKSRVTTQETLLQDLANVQPASEASTNVEQGEQGEAEKPKAKKTAQERISELASKRREAEAAKEMAERRAAELEERLRVLEQSKSFPTEESQKPKREGFASDDEYIEALTEWKAKEAIRQREQQAIQDRIKAEVEEIEAAHSKRMEKAIKEIEDYADVVSASNIQVPDALALEIKDSPVGPELVYYLAKNPQEAKRIFAQRPAKALRELLALEKELMREEPEEKPEVSKPKPKVPAPINPVKGSSGPDPAKPSNYKEYKARRMAEMNSGRR